MLLIKIVSLVVFAAVALQDVNYIGFILPDWSDKQSLSRLDPQLSLRSPAPAG